MKTVDLQKDVTIIERLKNGTSVTSLKHSQLEEQLISVSEITVTYCYGQLKRRRSQLAKLGFHLKETIWFNTKELHSVVKEIWIR
jgi:hypothetical protein